MARQNQNSQRELRELRQRVDRSAHAAEETLDAVSHLADSLGVIAGRMRRDERRIHLNSFAAYAIFTILLGAGFLALYHHRASSLEEARRAVTAERDAAIERRRELEAELAARDAS